MWYAVDLFTNEIHGPYTTEVEALLTHKGEAVDVQYRKFRKARKTS